MLKRRSLVASMSLLAICASYCKAMAGEATLTSNVFVNTDTSDIVAASYRFINPNDTSVVMNFVVILPTTTSSSGPGIIVNHAATEDGLQSATIPALGEFDVNAADIAGTLSSQDGFASNIVGEQVTVQASWPDDVLSSDGSLRKLTPIKAFITYGLAHSTESGLDAFKAYGVTQVQ